MSERSELSPEDCLLFGGSPLNRADNDGEGHLSRTDLDGPRQFVKSPVKKNEMESEQLSIEYSEQKI